MKAGMTDLEVGTVVRVVSITDEDPDEAIGVVGSVGEITHPFGDYPDTIAGIWVLERGNKPVNVMFPADRVGLCRGDCIEVVDTGRQIFL